MSESQQMLPGNNIIDICGRTTQIPNTAVFVKRYDYNVLVPKAQHNQRINISIVPASVPQDAGRLHRWMNTSHVNQYWQQAWPPERIRHYLEQQIRSYHDVYIIYINNMPAAYSEVYPTCQDIISDYYNSQEGDYGWHLLIGPKSFLGSGIGIGIGHCLLSYLFDQKNTNTLYCEPDHNNQRMIRFVNKLAHRDQGLITMKTKTARLMRCQKDEFLALSTPTLIINHPAAMAL